MRLRRIPVQLRAASDEEGGEGVLIGYATTYDMPYKVGRNAYESITRGAFDDDIADREGVYPIFYEHGWAKEDPQVPIGIGYFRSDDKGVHVKAELFTDDLAEARVVYRSAKAGSLKEWSLGFGVNESRFDSELRTLEHVDRGFLLEASVVVKGAADTEMIEVRSATIVDEPEAETEQGSEQEQPVLLDEAWSLFANPAVREAFSVMVQSDIKNAQPTEES